MRRLTAIRIVLAFVCAALASLPGGDPALAENADATAQRPRIAVLAIVDHPDIDAMRRGIGDSLRARGLSPGRAVTLDYRTANADPARVEALADALAENTADLVIALSEPMARAVAGRPLRIPIIVSGLPIDRADAIAAGREAKLLTGVAFGAVAAAQFELIETMRPDVRRVLVPWRNAAGSEAASLRALTAGARTRSFAVAPWPLPAIGSAPTTLPAGADPATSLVYLASGMIDGEAAALIAAAARHAMPVVADSRDLVIRGATAAIVHDFYAIGRQTGNLAAAILHDPTRARQPIRQADARHLVVNGETATDPRLRLAVPLDALAHEVIAWAEPKGPNPRTKPTPPESGPAAIP
ncbi:MAG: ABC transporter substrate binding protein [Alphaproteobacteria bacterium]|jgi:putative ABC transport system substrate-binding protein